MAKLVQALTMASDTLDSALVNSPNKQSPKFFLKSPLGSVTHPVAFKGLLTKQPR